MLVLYRYRFALFDLMANNNQTTHPSQRSDKAGHGLAQLAALWGLSIRRITTITHHRRQLDQSSACQLPFTLPFAPKASQLADVLFCIWFRHRIALPSRSTLLDPVADGGALYGRQLNDLYTTSE